MPAVRDRRSIGGGQPRRARTPFEFVAITIGRNDTLDQIFRGLQLKLSDLAELRSLPDVRKSLDMIRPGDVIQLTHLDGEIKSLTRRINETATLSVTRAEEGFSANIVENPLETEERMLRGTVDSSLYVAVNSAGGTDRLAVEARRRLQVRHRFRQLGAPGRQLRRRARAGIPGRRIRARRRHTRRRVRQRRPHLSRGALRFTGRPRRLLHAGRTTGSQGVSPLSGRLRAASARASAWRDVTRS